MLAGIVARSAPDDPLKERALRLNAITGDEPIKGQIAELLADAEGSKKLIAAAVELAKDKKQPFQYNAALILGESAFQLRQYEPSLTFYRICLDEATKLKSPRKLAAAFNGLIANYQITKKYDQVAKICQEYLELPGDEEVQRQKIFAMEQLIRANARSGKTDEAMRLTDNLIKASKDQGWLFLELRAFVLTEAEKYDEAAKTYLEYIEKLDDAKITARERDRQVDRTRYMLSSVYVDLKQIDKAAEQLKILLKRHPENPTFLNDLGFIWADNDMNLDESEKMIRNALELDKKRRKGDSDLQPGEDRDNAAYLDSLAWVLFKKKQYAEAKKYILEAAKDKEDGHHLEIYDHLADIHMALGEKAEAIAAWKKGLTFEDVSKRDKKRRIEVEKKLKAAEAK
jgi:predicted Zn-dependent protease